MTVNSNLPNETYNQLRKEYLDWLTSVLLELENKVEAINQSEDPTEIIVHLLREAHNIKGASASFGFATISIIAHRFEDYLNEASKSRGNKDIVPDLVCFLDQMQVIGDIGSEPREEVSEAMLHRLPIYNVEVSENKLNDVNVDALIISPSNTVSSIARKILEQSGVRTTASRISTEGLMLAIKAKPDIVIFSREMDVLSGTDLALALHAMKQTRQTTLILITSADKSHPDIKSLPNEIKVVFESGKMIAELVAIIDACIKQKQN